MEDRSNIDLECLLELLFVGALVGTVHLAAPCGQLQAGLLGAKRDGAGKVAREARRLCFSVIYVNSYP